MILEHSRLSAERNLSLITATKDAIWFQACLLLHAVKSTLNFFCKVANLNQEIKTDPLDRIAVCTVPVPGWQCDTIKLYHVLSCITTATTCQGKVKFFIDWFCEHFVLPLTTSSNQRSMTCRRCLKFTSGLAGGAQMLSSPLDRIIACNDFTNYEACLCTVASVFLCTLKWIKLSWRWFYDGFMCCYCR